MLCSLMICDVVYLVVMCCITCNDVVQYGVGLRVELRRVVHYTTPIQCYNQDIQYLLDNQHWLPSSWSSSSLPIISYETTSSSSSSSSSHSAVNVNAHMFTTAAQRRHHSTRSPWNVVTTSKPIIDRSRRIIELRPTSGQRASNSSGMRSCILVITHHWNNTLPATHHCDFTSSITQPTTHHCEFTSSTTQPTTHHITVISHHQPRNQPHITVMSHHQLL